MKYNCKCNIGPLFTAEEHSPVEQSVLSDKSIPPSALPYEESVLPVPTEESTSVDGLMPTEESTLPVPAKKSISSDGLLCNEESVVESNSGAQCSVENDSVCSKCGVDSLENKDLFINGPILQTDESMQTDEMSLLVDASTQTELSAVSI